MARSIGVILPAAALVLATFMPVSDMARAGILLAFVISGGLIGRWWAPVPSVPMAVAIALPLIGLAGGSMAAALLRRIRGRRPLAR